MQKICERLKTIKSILRNGNNKLLLCKEHMKYFKYCSTRTREIQEIIDTVDSNNLSELEKLISIYLSTHDKSDVIYHYCPMETFKAILDSKSLWLSDSEFMNDKYEGRWVDKIVQEVIKSLQGVCSYEVLTKYQEKYHALRNKKAYEPLADYQKQPTI